MNILFLGQTYAGHSTPCKELVKALLHAKHTVTHLKYTYPDSSPASFGVWLSRAQSKIEENLATYAPLVASGKFDLLISELPVFAAIELKAKYGIPWVVFNALPLFCGVKDADLFLQASIPEFENWKSYKNLAYVGFFVEKSTITFGREHKLKPIVHVTQGTLDVKDDFLIQEARKASQNGWRDNENNYLLVSEPVPHKIWMPFFDVFITNGGFGGVSQAIYHGVPIICAGETEDKPIVAEKVEKAGIGINLRTAKPTKMQLSAAINTCLNDERLKENCRRLSKLAKSYNYAKAVSLIEQVQCKA